MKINVASLSMTVAVPQPRTGSISAWFKVIRFKTFRFKAFQLLTVACLLSGCVAWAAVTPFAIDDDGPADTAHPATDSRAVRLSNVEGGVQVFQDGEVVADPALANQPIFEGSEISTGNDGRAELQLEDGSIARLSPNTSLVFSVLQHEGTGTRTEVVLKNGLAYFELQPSTSDHSLRVNYGPAYFTAGNFSVVRLTNDAPPAELAVFSGSVHVERGDALQLDIHGGESLTLDASDQSRYNLSSSIAADSWDQWNTDRDQFLNSQAADKTAATNGLKGYPSDGMSDLDANGNWYNVPGQGYVWSPYDAESAGPLWDPYGYGNWVSYPQYGYVWVSSYSWGYTPFQCGLWDYYESFGWAWAPGTGCSPWWGAGVGYYGSRWGYRFGNNFPPGYHPPRRPGGPVHPIPRPRNADGTPSPRPSPPHRGPSAPTIAVDRRPAGTAGQLSSMRSSGPVEIAGQTVEPLRPLAPRQTYLHNDNGYVNRSMPASGYAAGSRPGYTAPMHPSAGQYVSRPYSPPASHPQPPPAYGGGAHFPVGGGAAPRSAPPPPPPHK
jgi:FecR protein